MKVRPKDYIVTWYIMRDVLYLFYGKPEYLTELTFLRLLDVVLEFGQRQLRCSRSPPLPHRVCYFLQCFHRKKILGKWRRAISLLCRRSYHINLRLKRSLIRKYVKHHHTRPAPFICNLPTVIILERKTEDVL